MSTPTKIKSRKMKKVCVCLVYTTVAIFSANKSSLAQNPLPQHAKAYADTPGAVQAVNFTVVGEKSANWSADDNTKDVIATLVIGGTAGIHYNANTNYIDGGHHTPTEMKLTISPAGLGLDLSQFDIHQTYDVTETVTDQAGQSLSGAPVHYVDPPWRSVTAADLPSYVDDDNGGDVIYFMDGPGVNATDMPNLAPLFNDPDFKSVKFHYDFKVQPRYKGDDIGQPFTWSAELTATKNGTTIVWS